MALTSKQKKQIEETIIEAIRSKIENYERETTSMPFHYRLIGRDRMAMFSVIHSLNTTFGMSIYEPVAEILAKPNFEWVKKQISVGTEMSKLAQGEIEKIVGEITTENKKSNKVNEIERIREVCNQGEMTGSKPAKVDLLLKSKDGTIHMFDLKTVKPNKSNFEDFKKTLLKWIAIYLAQNPNAKVASYIAIPYNPYEPEPYEIWTLGRVLDIKKELKVDKEFWDFLGGDGAYENLLECVEQAGVKIKCELNKFFKTLGDSTPHNPSSSDEQ